MAFINYIHRYPFLLFIIPLLSAILFGDLYFVSTEYKWSYFLIGILFIQFILFLFYRRYSGRWLFGSISLLYFFVLGFCITQYHLEKISVQWPEDKIDCIATITEEPEEKNKTFLCTAQVRLITDKSFSKKVLLYLPKDSLITHVKVGTQLLIHTRINPPKNQGNPGEFDYAKYLIHKGVSGTAFVSASNWQLIGESKTINLRQQSLKLRKKLLESYKKKGFDGEEYAVLSALSLGYKEELSEDIKKAYSVSGVSHILALSGLHIGILFFFLNFLLDKIFFGSRKVFSLLKVIIIIGTLWIFAFLSGLSPSILRSVIMFTFIALFYMKKGPSPTFHILTLTAFFLLLYNPFYAFDLSFQLSFIAVASIVLIHPWLSKKIEFKNKIVNYIWELFTISLVAQLGTFPLILYKFGTFPTYFLLTNLLIIPLVTLLLYSTVIFWAFSFIPFLQTCMAWIMKILLSSINAIIRYIESLSFAGFENISFSQLQVLGIYSILLGVLISFNFKKVQRIKVILMSILVGSLFFLPDNWKNDSPEGILFYNSPSQAIQLIADSKNSYLINTEEETSTFLNQMVTSFCRKNRVSYPIVLDDSCEDNRIKQYHNLFFFKNKTICLLSADKIEYPIKKTDLYPIDYLYIGKAFKGNIEEITHLFSIKNLVFSSSIKEKRLKFLIEESEKLNIPFHSLSEGALWVCDF